MVDSSWKASKFGCARITVTRKLKWHILWSKWLFRSRKTESWKEILKITPKITNTKRSHFGQKTWRKKVNFTTKRRTNWTKGKGLQTRTIRPFLRTEREQTWQRRLSVVLQGPKRHNRSSEFIQHGQNGILQKRRRLNQSGIQVSWQVREILKDQKSRWQQ